MASSFFIVSSASFSFSARSRLSSFSTKVDVVFSLKVSTICTTSFRPRTSCGFASVAAGKKKIILNLQNVTYIDSSGLGTLVATFHTARSQGATLKLANLGAKFKEVLQVTKLMTVFDTYDSETAAIQSFEK